MYMKNLCEFVKMGILTCDFYLCFNTLCIVTVMYSENTTLDQAY